MKRENDLTVEEIDEIMSVMDSQPDDNTVVNNELTINSKGFFVKLTLKNKDVFVVSKEYVTYMDKIVNQLQKELKVIKAKLYNLETKKT